jgi:hypothetical protein
MNKLQDEIMVFRKEKEYMKTLVFEDGGETLTFVNKYPCMNWGTSFAA